MMFKDFFEGATTFYEFLKLSQNATKEEIHSAYSDRMLELNEFLNTCDVKNSTSDSIESSLRLAYDILSNPQLRGNYDRMLEMLQEKEKNNMRL